MEKQIKNGKIAVISVFVLGIILTTITGAFAWFSYSKTGLRENSISSGSITFHYDEKSQGLSIRDAMPMTDEEGMAQETYFEFDITSKTSSTVEIPYYVTVNKTSGSTASLDSYIKVYLTKMVNNVETPVALLTGDVVPKYSELGSYTNSSINIPATEKALYTDTVPTNSSNYKETYRLRMWIDYNINMNPNGTGESPYNGSTYTLKVNVYGSGAMANSYTVTYNANGGTGTMNSTINTIAANTFTAPAGKMFKEWNTQSDGQGTTYTTTSPVTSNLTLYAIWENYVLACPGEGCKYLYKAVGHSYSTSDILEYGPNARDLTQAELALLEDDYQDVITSNGKNYFLGVKLNGNKIEHAYACGIKNDQLFCIEGALNDASGGNEETRTAIFNANKDLVQSPSLWNGGCDPGSSYIMCNTALSALMNTDGNVATGAGENSCHVENDGDAICYEW